MDAIPYNPRLKLRARERRNNSTLAEILLWNQLRRGQRCGRDFHRQKPILEWIADFYCAELQLVIEIDGETHRFNPVSDQAKESAFRSLGIATLRFGDTEVKKNMAGVTAAIDRWIQERTGAAPRSHEHTPPFGHPSLEGTSACGSDGKKSLLERGGRGLPRRSGAKAGAPGCVRPKTPSVNPPQP